MVTTTGEGARAVKGIEARLGEVEGLIDELCTAEARRALDAAPPRHAEAVQWLAARVEVSQKFHEIRGAITS